MDPSREQPGDLNESAEPPPLGQRLFDNMYLLLVLGVAVMLVVFTGWGIWEVVSMPKGTLP
jgi:hypothetical protein